jgi:hypothetical protein
MEEEQKIGVDKHEEFHKMIDQLQNTYLKPAAGVVMTEPRVSTRLRRPS